MRVAIDARLVAYQRAGIGHYVLGLLDGARTIGRAKDTLVLVSRRQAADDPAFAGFSTRRVLTPPHHRFEQLALPLELATVRADVLHATDFIPPLLDRRPCVATIHDLYFLRAPEALTADSRRYYGQVGPAVRRARRLIAVSDATRRDLLELLDARPERVDVVHEAPDPSFTPSPQAEIDRARLELGLPERYLLFVGTLEPRKNLPRLLEAVAADPTLPPIAFAGAPGWIDERLPDRATRLGLGDRVRWLGRVDRRLLAPLYSGALAFAFPSLYEGFGLPVLEAMACGTPVVASRAGSLPEVAGDAALLVDPLDVGALSAALSRVSREPALREELRGRGRARAAAFSWRRTAEETWDVYRRAA